jgi:hypothetical protein
MEFIHEFKKDHSVAVRKEKYELYRRKHPTRVPVIIDRMDSELPSMKDLEQKNTFLFPSTSTFHECLVLVRKKLNLNAEDSLFIFVQEHGIVPAAAETMGAIHKTYKNPDDEMLYLVYTKERTFG